MLAPCARCVAPGARLKCGWDGVASSRRMCGRVVWPHRRCERRAGAQAHAHPAGRRVARRVRARHRAAARMCVSGALSRTVRFLLTLSRLGLESTNYLAK